MAARVAQRGREKTLWQSVATRSQYHMHRSCHQGAVFERRETAHDFFTEREPGSAMLLWARQDEATVHSASGGAAVAVWGCLMVPGGGVLLAVSLANILPMGP